MKIEVITLTEEALERREYNEALTIKIDGKKVFEVYDGEHEDNNLMRNFKDCFKISELLEKVYYSGQNHEGLEIEYSEVDEF